MLSGALRKSIEHAIAQFSACEESIANVRPLGGGCINEVHCITMSGGPEYLLKVNRNVPADFFRREAEGLEALRRAGSIRVPRPLSDGFCTESRSHYLLTEFVPTGRKGNDFFEVFGNQLAELHRRSTQPEYGFATDNYLGSTVQVNRRNESWIEFFAESRIGYQVRLANQNQLATPELNRLSDRFCDRLDSLLSDSLERPALIHGDLWGGNFLVDPEGKPVLIDPAAHFAHREAELAMTQLFGGFSQEFYDAYHETWPLQDGWPDRLELYKLYHLLNHLNLFGTSYLSGCLAILRRYTS